MDIIFAPDWREGVPYQRLLADALVRQGVNVTFLQGYKRIMPLSRLLAERRCDILHLHWPEAYYPRKQDGWDWFRRARFTTDLGAALKHCVLATTAHNLHAHNRAREPFARANIRFTHRRAGVTFAHSEVARQKLIEAFGLTPEVVRIIPHGDLSVALGGPVAQSDARRQLGLPSGKLVLMFGAIEPYKGQEEIIDWWKSANPDATLAIVGNPISPAFGAQIASSAAKAENVMIHLGWLTDEQLRVWLSAADAALFNYREIFTSGAANLARSWGLPVLLPARLDTVVLDEPTPFVHRFDDVRTDLGRQLVAALNTRPDYPAASAWRSACSWDHVASLTAAGYRAALGS